MVLGGGLFLMSEVPLYPQVAGFLAFLFQTVNSMLIQWFLSSQLPHKTVNLLFTMFTISNSKQLVDGFVGE